MESLYLFVCIFFLSGKTFTYTEAESIFDVGASFLHNFGRGGYGSDYHDKERKSHRKHKDWWETATGTPEIKNIFSDTPTDNPSNNKVKPNNMEPTDVLVKLKHMKDEVKGNGTEVDDNQTNVTDNTNLTPRDVHSCQININDNTPLTPDGKKVMRAITKKHFYFQAQTVRPEGEEVGKYKRVNETIYYINS